MLLIECMALLLCKIIKTSNSLNELIWRQKNAFKAPCSFGGGGFVLVDLLVYVPPSVCGGCVLVFI